MIINIEMCHIYTDEEPGEEQRQSIKKTKEALDALRGDMICLTVLLDDYHVETQSLVMTEYIDWLEAEGVRPHYVGLEGDLRKLAYRLLYSIPRPLRKDVSDWMEDRDKFPCSLLSATWYLARFGLFRDFNPIRIGERQILVPDQLINVLPEKYKKNEERALELISASAFSRYAENIKYEWF